MKTELKTIKDKVEGLLRRTDWVGYKCRNNDNFLALYYAYEYHSDLDIAINPYIDPLHLAVWANELPPLDTFKRIRAHFQNTEGKYLPDDEISYKREIEEARYKREFSKGL